MAVETRKSTCNRDCPDACGLVAEVENGRILSLRGDADHPVTRGFLCFRTSRFPEMLRAPHRLTRPLLRRGGELVEVELDEALDVAAERLARIRAESGPEAILHYRSGGSLGLLKGIADRFFEAFGPCAGKVGDICSGAGEAAQIEDFGVSDSNDLFDLLEARHILLWGKNPTTSNTHLVPVLRDARARGTRIHLIDPVRHKAVALADEVLHPVPGGDLALALGVGAVLFARGQIDPHAAERCDGLEDYRSLVGSRTPAEWAQLAGVSVAAVEALAAALADGPTAILVGWGMQRRLHGGAIVRAVDALSAISGNLFRSGGGCSFYFKRRAPFANDALSSGLTVRRLREPLLGQDLLAADPPVRALWITAGNPVCMLPDSARVAEALEKTEFVVVVDPFLTDTGRRADLVLPVPTLLEDSDLLPAYGHHWIGESRPLVPAPDGVVHEVELFQRLAARLGLGEALSGSVDTWKERLLAPIAAQGVTLDALRDGAVRSPTAPKVLFGEGRVRTPNGRVQLLTAIDEAALARAAAPSPGFPLWLFSNSTPESQAAQWARDPGARMAVTLHPDAAPEGARDGEDVVVESPQGSLPAKLRLDAAQRSDVAIVPKGGWFDRGLSANALIAAVPTDLGLGAAYLDCRVRVRRP
ncbi:MAG: molybdopterin-containing oxidoreductase family protein [Planctomycetota bacterium]